jgi:AraC-like DNA-binding protein
MESPQNGSRGEERIVPDGCSEIVFNLGDSFEQFNDDGSICRQPLNLLVGQMQRPLLIAPTGRVRLLGVRFWPGGAYPFLKLPQDEIAGQVIALDDIWGNVCSRLQSRIADAASPDEAAKQVEAILLKRFDQFRRHDEGVLTATDLILRAGGRLSIRNLSDTMGINSRTLDRRFKTVVGLPPKALSRIVRFQQVFRMIQPNGATDWARLALDLGYYDQPHFIREFKAFTGKEPTAYFSDTNLMSDHFTGNS